MTRVHLTTTHAKIINRKSRVGLKETNNNKTGQNRATKPGERSNKKEICATRRLPLTPPAVRTKVNIGEHRLTSATRSPY